ncbi:hypothetical protein KF913_07735 [Candidatus Obscuribacterales bacterium]|nr:hypothetical protein [Candidatus Obscuribacterales bacterium]
MPTSRARLSTVLRAANEVVSVDLVARTLELDRSRAAKLLSRWTEQGWLRRVSHGLYVPVPIDLAGNEQVVEDPWVLIPPMFGQCYVGGWTAAHHWELTEQLFNETVVFTTQRSPKRHVAQGIVFVIHRTTEDRLFGLKTLWRGSARVSISDPARTVVDMLAMPESGGGVEHVAECLKSYVEREKGDKELLVQYAERFSNGAIFKRLGFLAETILHDDELADACRARLTQGYAHLESGRSCERLVTAWRLWIPESWSKAPHD